MLFLRVISLELSEARFLNNFIQLLIHFSESH